MLVKKVKDDTIEYVCKKCERTCTEKIEEQQEE